MCIVTWSIRKINEQSPDSHDTESPYALILGFNRDEFFNRNTQPLQRYPQETGKNQDFLVCGRDLENGGTWFGVSSDGRIAFLTNYREPLPPKKNSISRGKLVWDFLAGDLKSPAFYLDGVGSQLAAKMDGFNLVCGKISKDSNSVNVEFEYLTNRPDPTISCRLSLDADGKGSHGSRYSCCSISNGTHADQPRWPKVLHLEDRMNDIVHKYSSVSDESKLIDELFRMFEDTTTFPDERLPQTKLPLSIERHLCSVFIPHGKLPVYDAFPYGTRTTTLLLVRADGQTSIIEKTRHLKIVAPDSYQIRADIARDDFYIQF